MASVVDICNYALAKVGEQTIVSLGDGTPESNRCDLLYPLSRDFVLRMHPWNCAIKRVKLAASSTEPVYEFDNRYPLPSDCLRVLDVDLDPQSPWKIEGRAIYADVDGALSVRYVSRLEDTQQMDVHVIDAIASYLALQLVEPLTQSNTKKQLLMDDFRTTIGLAKRSDAQEDSPGIRESGTWLRSRI